jgi:hypothetical protein
LNGLDDGPGIGGVGLADGMGVDVSVSEWSLQADPARSRNASAMPLSSFFTIECYDSMRQRNQIYLKRGTKPPTNSKLAHLKRLKMFGLVPAKRVLQAVGMQLSADRSKRTTARKLIRPRMHGRRRLERLAETSIGFV